MHHPMFVPWAASFLGVHSLHAWTQQEFKIQRGKTSSPYSEEKNHVLPLEQTTRKQQFSHGPGGMSVWRIHQETKAIFSSSIRFNAGALAGAHDAGNHANKVLDTYLPVLDYYT